MNRGVRLVPIDTPWANEAERGAEEVGFYDKVTVDYESRIAALEAEMLLRTRWRGAWIDSTYEACDQVIDSNWLAIANKQTADRPAPQPQGVESWVYQGTSPDDTIDAKELFVSQRYSFGVNRFINGWRYWEVLGNEYRAYIIYDPDGIAQVENLLVWTALADGWVERNIIPKIAIAGTKFDLVIAIKKPADVPVSFSGPWNYQTPNNEATPGAGVISHAKKAMDSLRVNKEDDDGTDRSIELEAITPGDTISGAGIAWSVQAVADMGAWIDFTVAPATQGAPDDVQTFTFESVLSTPIQTIVDPDYYLNESQVSGWYKIDAGAPVETQAAYGIDILIQQVAISPDWDLQAKTGE